MPGAMVFQMFKQKPGNLKGRLSLGSLCLGSVCIGLTLGWPESSLRYFLMNRCRGRCYRLLSDDGATVQMMMNCGSCIGAILPSCIADTYGRKLSFAIAGAFNFVFWAMLIIFQGHAEIIYVAVIGGIAAGVFVTTTALYVSEISLPHTRSATGALAAFCAYVGALVGNCLIFMTFIRVIALIIMGLTTLFLVSLYWWMIESPYFFFLQGRSLDAKLSLKVLRGATSVLEIDPEYRTIELFFSVIRKDSRLENPEKACFPMLKSRERRFAALVIIFLCITQMFGAYGMNDLSKAFLDHFLPNYGRILTSALDVVSVAVCLYVITTIGRKNLLLVISIVGSSVSCFILAIITIVRQCKENHNEDYDSAMFVTASILTLYYVIYSLGLIPILPILTGEIFSARHRTVTLCLCISFIYLSSMTIQFFFELLNGRKGRYLAFASFAIFGSLGMPFVLIFLPETQGKALHEIQEEFDEFAIIIS